MSKTHELKIIEPYYSDMRSGKKNFEIRKNDRDFKVNDRLIFRCYNLETKAYEKGLPLICSAIKYITDYQQKDGYVVLGLM